MRKHISQAKFFLYSVKFYVNIVVLVYIMLNFCFLFSRKSGIRFLILFFIRGNQEITIYSLNIFLIIFHTFEIENLVAFDVRNVFCISTGMSNFSFYLLIS